MYLHILETWKAWRFADQIELALGGNNDAGWIVYFSRISWSPRTFSCMLVETTPLANDEDCIAAKALVEALQADISYLLGRSK